MYSLRSLDGAGCSVGTEGPEGPTRNVDVPSKLGLPNRAATRGSSGDRANQDLPRYRLEPSTQTMMSRKGFCCPAVLPLLSHPPFLGA